MWAQWLDRTLDTHNAEAYAERRAWRVLRCEDDEEARSPELDPRELMLVAREMEKS
jgi:hypothetical protein